MIKTLFILLLFYSLFLCWNRGEKYQLIDEINAPHQIEWISDEELLIVKEKHIFKYDIYSKSIERVGEREPNSFVGLETNGKLIFCEFEHFLINSPEEFSTIFRIKDENGNLRKEIKIFETIRPIQMDEKEIIAVTAVDILEEHFYKINIDSEEKVEIPSPIKKYNLNIPKYFDVRRVFVRDKNLYLIEDMKGNLILYNNFINTRTIIPMLTAIFKPVPIKNPKNDANPSLILWFKSFLANMYSAAVAPKNAPMNTPGMLPINPPSIEPNTEPIDPYLEPPAFLVPSAAASSSANVDNTDMKKRITRINGVITSKFPIAATITVAI